jgi:serine/threonine protein phosphatase PrpC
MPLVVQLGHCSRTGTRERNEDFVGMVSPSGDDRVHKGYLTAIADGVSGNNGGREAAEYCVRGLITDYYATPDTWEPLVALDRVLQPLNKWILSQGQHRRELGGMATTLTALLFRGRCYYFAHVGDTRAYLFRNAKLARLTMDHVWDRPDMNHVLTRGIGLDTRLTPDYGDGALQQNDRFLLVSDGVWSALTMQEVEHLLAASSNPEETASALCEAALAAGSQDNVSAIVVRIDELPEDGWEDVVTLGADLLPPPQLKPGQELDGFRVEEILRRSAATIIYRVTDTASGRKLVLKSLMPERGSDPVECNHFLHESWIAKRVIARFFPQVIDIAPQRRSALYYVQTWHEGATLGAWLETGRHFQVPELVQIGVSLARALGALHRRSILHRDVKPENVHLGSDGEMRLLDFGIAISGLSPQTSVRAQAGTPSYIAPEQFDGAPASAQTDLYAAGVTLYHVLTRKYPYGEIEPFQHPRFGDPVPPARYRPDIPEWLENVLLKAVAREPATRFETAEEFLLALERGAARPLAAPAPTPLLGRLAAERWRAAALISLALNALLIYLIIALSAR